MPPLKTFSEISSQNLALLSLDKKTLYDYIDMNRLKAGPVCFSRSHYSTDSKNYYGSTISFSISLSFRNAKSNEGVDGVVVDIEISELLTGKIVSSLLLKVENATNDTEYKQGAFYNLYYHEVFDVAKKVETLNTVNDSLLFTFINLTNCASFMPI